MISELEQRVRDAFREEKARPEKQPILWDLIYELDEYHPMTAERSLIVALKAREIAIFWGFQSRGALYGGCGHDIGKLGIPLEILDKTRGYNEDDHKVMMQHSLIGYEILMKEGLVMSAWIALTHHRHQRHPYPKKLPPFPEGLSTEDARQHTYLYSIIVAVADKYEGFHRSNDMYGDIPLTNEQIRVKLIEEIPLEVNFIKRLYDNGILV
jgi:response regulator RpfG family c-di-GMP phosphodiesterase